MKVYLAGPDVFLPDAKRIGHLKREICERHGLEGLFPLDADPPKEEPLSRGIFRANTALMDRADAIIANLTPFRGPSADVGTVYELGYMLGKGNRLCLGYSNIGRSYLDKVRGHTEVHSDGTGEFHDSDGMTIEDFGLSDNLMIVHGLELSGHFLVTPTRDAEDPLHDLSTFEACVRIAAGHKDQALGHERHRARLRS